MADGEDVHRVRVDDSIDDPVLPRDDFPEASKFRFRRYASAFRKVAEAACGEHDALNLEIGGRWRRLRELFGVGDQIRARPLSPVDLGHRRN
jgi:hypothetical protein